MKKVYRGIGITFLILIAIGIGLGVRYFLYDPTADNVPMAKPTVVDSVGSTYLAVVDEGGTTYAVVTDSEGNRYAAEYNGSQVGNTLGQINDQVSLEDVPDNNQSGSKFEVTASGNFQGNVSQTPTQSTAPTTTQPSTTPSQPQQNVSVTTTVPAAPGPYDLVPYRIDKYSEIFKSGKYLMEFTTDDPDLSGQIVMATKDGKVYMQTAMALEEAGETIPMKMIFRNDDEPTMYLLFENFKKYSKLPQDMLGEEMDMTDMMSDFTESDIGKITVSEVSINSQRLILESYVSPVDGSTVNYYFDGDVLVRRDLVYSDGGTESIYFTKITTDVPDSLFEIPAGYSYLNLSWLGALM